MPKCLICNKEFYRIPSKINKSGKVFCSRACSDLGRIKERVRPEDVVSKKCSKCGTVKAASEFYESKLSVNGLISRCKACDAALHRQWQEENQDKARANHCSYRSLNREKTNESQRIWRTKNLEKARIIQVRAGRKMRSTPKGTIRDRMSANINHSLGHGVKAGRKWESLVGYTASELKAHIEKLFKPGMTWENRKLWHLDHIVPVSAFNFKTPEDSDFKKCWNLKNFRPLWALENLKKSDKFACPFQPSLAMNMEG